MGNCQRIKIIDINHAIQTFPPKLILKSSNWDNNSCGLIDYNSKDFTSKTFEILKNSILILNNNQINVKERNKINKKDKKLLNINFENGFFSVSSVLNNYNKLKEVNKFGLWKIIKFSKTNNNEGIILKTGDIIKIGKIFIKITLVCLKEEENNFEIKNHLKINNNLEILNNEQSENIPCRICLSDENFKENPLISPCKCIGSTKYIHLVCIKKWFESKKIYKTTFYSISIDLKDLKCELCKSKFNKEIFFNKAHNNFLDLNKFKPPFMIFETIKKSNNEIQSFNIIKLNYKPNIFIGRNVNNDIRINDISVSRSHCKFQLKSDGIYLIDNNSKFGSLVLIQNKIDFSKENNNLYFQLDKFIFNVFVQAKWKYYQINNLNTENDKKVNNNDFNFLNYDDENSEILIEINNSDDSDISSEINSNLIQANNRINNNYYTPQI